MGVPRRQFLRSAAACLSTSGAAGIPGRCLAGANAKPSELASTSHPGSLLDLSAWKLTLPVDQAREVTQPDLARFSRPGYFEAVGDTVVFTAPCGGDTTRNSRYPRCELREMASAGRASAAWSTGTGRHEMVLTGAVLELPPQKPQVVFAQIHDDRDDVIEVLADGLARRGRIVIGVRWRGRLSSDHLDDDYRLGSPYDLRVLAAGGVVRVSYRRDGSARSDQQQTAAERCYFKAGCYTQSNPSRGDAPDALGRTAIKTLRVEHA